MSESQTLTVYERMPDQLQAAQVLGAAIAKSGMFGCGSVEAGIVFATECMFRGLPPLTMAQRYHVIFGKLSMKAEAMLAGFEAEGGTYKVLSRTPDLVSIEFTPPGGGKPEVLSLSWEEAQKEPFVYEGKEEAIVDALAAGKKPKLKPKYATPRSRMQMLWARLVSDSVRFLCPRVVSGVYTPEESEDIHEANGHAVAPSASVAASTADKTEAAAKEAAVDVPFETKPAAEQSAATTIEPPIPADDSGFSTADQRQAIQEAFAQLGMTVEQQQTVLAKRGVNSLRSLTAAQAGELIDRLKAKQKEIADVALPKVEPGNEPVYSASGQCTVAQEQRIKAALAEWKQIDPAAFDLAMASFKQKLVESGKQKIIDLSANDAARLYDCVQTRKLASFLHRSLEEWKRPESNGRTATAAS